MSGIKARLSGLVSQVLPSVTDRQAPYTHALSPTYFLPRAALIEPNAPCIYHKTSNGRIIRRSYRETAQRSAAFAYYIKNKGFRRVGILCPNTPAFLEAIFGVGGSGGVNIAINYRLKADDIAYIFQHADVDVILVDAEFVSLLDVFRRENPQVPIIIDTDTDATDHERGGDFDRAVLEGQAIDDKQGSHGWHGLETEAPDENGVIALAYTSGTTARPKGVEYTHRGAYMASIGNVVESGLNLKDGRCKYLWTLPMFHAMGWTFPWAVTASRGTHYCLRKIDYPEIWRLLRDEHITHYNAAPTVNTLLCSDPNAKRLSQHVSVTVAASPPTAHLFRQMIRLNLHPVHVYGLTETYGPITKGYHMPEWDDLPEDDKYERMARQGHGLITSLPCRVIKTDVPYGSLVDVEADGKEIGEVVFSGNICAKGYYNDIAATQKLFAGGVLHSGDLAVKHGDGAIQILDRAKDIIISGGENISSVALESMLVKHPDILEAGVAAVKDEKWGERPKAFITVKPGKDLKGPEVIEWARSFRGISRFMVPHEVEVVPELPKTSTGKIRKNVLRSWAMGGERRME